MLDEDHVGADIDVEHAVPFRELERLDRPDFLKHGRHEAEELELAADLAERRVDRRQVRLLGDVRLDADGLASGRLGDLGGDLIDRVHDVDQHEVPAVLGEALRRHAAHAAGRACDNSNIAHCSTILSLMSGNCPVASSERDAGKPTTVARAEVARGWRLAVSPRRARAP